MDIRKKTQDIYHDLKKFFTWSYLREILVNPSQLSVVAPFIIVAELILNILIVQRVPYTEIDWKAYMQECEGFLNGTMDYSQLRGDTGPLVYPAGFVYIYSLFYFLTNQGENIKLAQYVFIGIYLLQLFFVLRLYNKTRKVPPYVLVITILTSYRIHSIHVLRLFNDPIAVLFLYVSINLFIDGKWYLGSIFYSLGVSVKMNILLYVPALFFFYLINLGVMETVKQLFVCGFIQLILGLPFLISNPVAYIKGSFDVGRVFNHTWTVNYRFLEVSIFESVWFHLALFAMHIMLVIIFLPMYIRYFQTHYRIRCLQKELQPQIDAKNLELKKKKKVKIGQDPRLTPWKNIKTLTKDQETFLCDFENSLVTSQMANRKITKNTKEIDEEPSHYSIYFDALSQLLVLPMYLVNFIGIFCARSLHYQFYSWYFHSLPYLLWSCPMGMKQRFLILALIELCWNTYPSTNVTSALLHACHFLILFGLYRSMSKEYKFISKLRSEAKNK